MKYKVINSFTDVEDNNAFYDVGDDYPKGNFKPTKKRIDVLSTLHPKYRLNFIEEVEEKPAKSKSKPATNKE